MEQAVLCPICTGRSHHYDDIEGFPYYECMECGSLHIAPSVIAQMDAGQEPLGRYADEYWERERASAADRSSGESLCRSGEAILYCRRPVRRFLDVGSGPGYLVQNLQALLDHDAEIFHGVEKFPPEFAVMSPNYHVGDVAELALSFDAGVCIEVVEHLTPLMLSRLAAGLAAVSNPGTFWLFNTGMPDYVRNEDRGYLDPLRRGHIISYSLPALQRIFAEHGFVADHLPGKSFAFFAEFQPGEQPSFDDRIYRPLPENLQLLKRNGLLHQATLEAARAYFYFAAFNERTAWALDLDAQLKQFRRPHLLRFF